MGTSGPGKEPIHVAVSVGDLSGPVLIERPDRRGAALPKPNRRRTGVWQIPIVTIAASAEANRRDRSIPAASASDGFLPTLAKSPARINACSNHQGEQTATGASAVVPSTRA